MPSIGDVHWSASLLMLLKLRWIKTRVCLSWARWGTRTLSLVNVAVLAGLA